MAERSPYSATMNLPRTEFPMRASLPQREPERLVAWRDEDLYGRLRQARQGRPPWILHDGPPYANGDIHVGTAMNKVLKDIANRVHWLLGDDVAYVPGWDTHGLPIEHKALSLVGLDKRQTDPVEVRRVSREFALSHIEAMTEQFRRLGVLGDWDNPYITLLPRYEAQEVRVFGRLFERGLIVRGLRSVLWCPSCETALADAEIEYGPERSPSLYVAFPFVGDGALDLGLAADTRVVIWTTTAWTLPSNSAVAVHPEMEYEAVPTARGPLLLARARVEGALRAMGLERLGEGPRLSGRALEGAMLRGPLRDPAVPLVLADYVTAEDGTGLVHTAPGHGADDFQTGRRYGLEVLVGVDGSGRLTESTGAFAGLDWLKAEDAIVAELRRRDLLLGYDHFVHEYPHCWRCKGPVLFRATEQWFCTLDPLRPALARAVAQAEWVPAWGAERMGRMLAERDDWCISRQRVWGLPIPVLWCVACERPAVTAATIERIATIFEQDGADSWWQSPPGRFVPDGLACEACGGERFGLERDTLDVWFDAGSSHAAVLADRPDLHWPADLYLEGTDQFRGWFNLSTITAVAVRDAAPYRTVLCHGFVMDGEGRKMSKSLGNGVDAMAAVAERGADVMRLWVVSADFTADTRISATILDQVGDTYRKLRNTLRFLLANLGDFDPATAGGERLSPLDRWALSRLGQVAADCMDDYRALRLHSVYQRLYAYAVTDLSAFYLDMVKDRLYAEAPDAAGRRATQRVLWQTARWLILLLLPVMPFTAEEGWDHLGRLAEDPDRAALCVWPQAPACDAAVLADLETLRPLRERALAALEAERAAGRLRASLEAALHLRPGVAERLALEALGDDACLFFGTSVVTWEEGASADADRIGVALAPGERCARCWRMVTDAVPGEFGPLCPRCAAALKAVGASRGSAPEAG